MEIFEEICGGIPRRFTADVWIDSEKICVEIAEDFEMNFHGISRLFCGSFLRRFVRILLAVWEVFALVSEHIPWRK